jgi:hypothetical protein
VQRQASAGPEAVQALTQTVDEAVRLLRTGRYGDLEAHFTRLERQAKDLEALKQALAGGAPAGPGLQQRCEQLGKSLFVFSEVAKQVAMVEAGMVQMVAGPRDGSYDRAGNCEIPGGASFRQEA